MGVLNEVCVLQTCRFGCVQAAKKAHPKPVMDRFQLERSARRRAYEWEVLAARARSDLGALRERARAALTERSSALPTGFKI